jgi:hypothetical protein
VKIISRNDRFTRSELIGGDIAYHSGDIHIVISDYGVEGFQIKSLIGRPESSVAGRVIIDPEFYVDGCETSVLKVDGKGLFVVKVDSEKHDANTVHELGKRFRKILDQMGVGNPVCVLTEGIDLKLIDERLMEGLGWIRVEKIDQIMKEALENKTETLDALVNEATDYENLRDSEVIE